MRDFRGDEGGTPNMNDKVPSRAPGTPPYGVRYGVAKSGGSYRDGGVEVCAESGVHDSFTDFSGNLNLNRTHFKEQFPTLPRFRCNHTGLFVQIHTFDVITLRDNRENGILTRSALTNR